MRCDASVSAPSLRPSARCERKDNPQAQRHLGQPGTWKAQQSEVVDPTNMSNAQQIPLSYVFKKGLYHPSNPVWHSFLYIYPIGLKNKSGLKPKKNKPSLAVKCGARRPQEGLAQVLNTSATTRPNSTQRESSPSFSGV